MRPASVPTTLVSLCAVLLLAGAASAAPASHAPHKAKASAAEADDYMHDVISVTANTRTGVIPTANCVVWANAEGLGVGPAQLDGFHGVSMDINPKPLPSEAIKPVMFADGMAALKAKYPTTPAWMLAALEKHSAAIESACATEHETPLVIVKLTAKDKKG